MGMEPDWRTLEDKLLRRTAKAKAFRDLYSGKRVKRNPVRSVTGRMVVTGTPTFRNREH